MNSVASCLSDKERLSTRHLENDPPFSYSAIAYMATTNTSKALESPTNTVNQQAFCINQKTAIQRPTNPNSMLTIYPEFSRTYHCLRPVLLTLIMMLFLPSLMANERPPWEKKKPEEAAKKLYFSLDCYAIAQNSGGNLYRWNPGGSSF